MPTTTTTLLYTLPLLLLLGTASSSEYSDSLYSSDDYGNVSAACVKNVNTDKCDCDYVDDDSWEFSCTMACPYPLRCSGGRCVTSTENQYCTEDADCHQAIHGTGLVSCEDHKCVFKMNAGDACKKSSDCYGKMKCEKKHCVGVENKGNCTAYVPAVDPMIPGSMTGFSCQNNYFCGKKKGKCQENIGADEKCSVENGELCESGYLCNMGVCVKRFSVEDNGNCSVNIINYFLKYNCLYYNNIFIIIIIIYL